MAHYNNVKALKQGEVQKSHQLLSFYKTSTASSILGGGFFSWVEAANASINEVVGMVIKPATLSTGYWTRIHNNQLTPEMFGATGRNQTMAAQGITQPEADAIYGTGFCNVSTDTWDWTAIQTMVNAMGTQSYNVRSCIFATKPYYLSRGIQLPRIWATDHFVRIILDGNGCDIVGYGSPTYQTFPFFYVNNTTFADALNVQSNRSLTFKNFNLLGKPTNTANKSYGLKLSGGTFNRIEDCHFKGTNYGLWTGFAINNLVSNCFAQETEDVGFYIGQDTAISADANAVQSNLTLLQYCKVTGANIGMYIDRSNNCEVNGSTFEGNFSKCIYFDGNASTVKEFKVMNTHAEHSTGVGIYMKGHGTHLVVDRWFDQSSGTVIIESDPLSDTYIDVYNTPYLQGGSKYAHKGTDEAVTFWTFNRVAVRNNTIRDSSNWVTTAGYAVPKAAARETINGNTNVKVNQTLNPNNASLLPTGRLWENTPTFLQTATV